MVIGVYVGCICCDVDGGGDGLFYWLCVVV